MGLRKSDNVVKPSFLDDYNYIGKGIECQVFEIVKLKLVCKVYDSDADARYNYIMQKIGYRAGIAPKPLALESNYYFSQYVVSCEKNEKLKQSWCKRKDTKKFQQFLNKVQAVFGEGEWQDKHSGNIAYMQVGRHKKYVVIDFGIAGFISTHLGGLLATKLDLYYG